MSVFDDRQSDQFERAEVWVTVVRPLHRVSGGGKWVTIRDTR